MTPQLKLGLTIFVTVTLFLIAFAWELIWYRGRRWLALLICSIMLLVMLLTINFAAAHDHNQPDLNSWYMGLVSPAGRICCGGPTIDAVTLDGPQWEVNSGHYRVLLYGTWYDVPDDAVIKEPNKDGRTLVWPTQGYGGVTIRCFMPGSMT